jgi:pimeloyl-ACP methyl ester carboxylesterase
MTDNPDTTALQAPGPPTWPAGAVTRVIDLDGPVQLLEFPGPPDAPVVICLHGLGGSALNFGLLGPLLAETHRVMVPDLLGHGSTKASSARGNDAVESQLDLIAQLTERLTDGPAVLLGHSMGGVLALLRAARAPQTVSRLVLLDPPVPNPTRWARDPRLTAKLLLLRTPGVRTAVARQMSRLSAEQLAHRQLDDATPHADLIAEDAVAASIAENRLRATRADAADGQRAQWEAIIGVVALLARPAAWRRLLATITMPTLWLQGEDDRLVNPAAASALAATRPEWTFLTRPGVGHLPHLEDPSWTASTILAWLDPSADPRLDPFRGS